MSRRPSPIHLDAARAAADPRQVRPRRIAFGWYGGKFSHL